MMSVLRGVEGGDGADDIDISVRSSAAAVAPSDG
jgi:hypothetical protein